MQANICPVSWRLLLGAQDRVLGCIGETEFHHAFVGKPLQLLESVRISTTATTKIATTATATRTLLARSREIYRDGATGQCLAIQRINGFLRVRRRAQGNEPKSTGTSRFAVHHQVGFDNRAVRRKSVLQVVLREVEGKVSHKQFCTHLVFVLSWTALRSPYSSRGSNLKSSSNTIHLTIPMLWEGQPIKGRGDCDLFARNGKRSSFLQPHPPSAIAPAAGVALLAIGCCKSGRCADLKSALASRKFPAR
jgi:hypothetical protein